MGKAQIIDNSTYSGNVHVKAYNKGILYDDRIFHNTGTVNLCNYIRDCLKGENVIARRPGYMIPCSWNANEGLIPMFSYGILYTGTENGSDGQPNDSSSTYSLKFLIPSAIWLGKQKIEGFKLYSLGEDRSEYASVDIHLDPILLANVTNLSIEWDLKVSFK